MNVERKSFHGVWVAMVTPWGAEDNALKRDVLPRLISRFAGAGVAGLYILGTTGEGTLLPTDERRAFAEAVLESAAGSIPIIVHTGHDRTAVARALSRHAAAIGAAGVAVAPPCRYRFTREELRAHYLEIAAAVGDLPLFLYDIPSTTGNPLDADLLAALHADAPNVIGAKISRGDWDAWEGYLALAEEFVLLVGKDEMGFPLLAMGGSGLVSSCANLLPELYVSLYRAARSRNHEAGRKIQELITELCRVTRRGHVPTIKRALSLLGWQAGEPIPPLRPLPPADDADLSAQLVSIRSRAARWTEKGGESKEQ